MIQLNDIAMNLLSLVRSFGSRRGIAAAQIIIIYWI